MSCEKVCRAKIRKIKLQTGKNAETGSLVAPGFKKKSTVMEGYKITNKQKSNPTKCNTER